MLTQTLANLKKNKAHGNNILWSNFSQIILAANHFLLSIIIIRLAGKELYGEFLFILAIIGVFGIFSVSGVRGTILKAVSQGHDRTYYEGTKFSFLRSLLGVPIVLLIGGYFYYFAQKPDIARSLIIISAFFPFFSSLKTWSYFLQGKSQFKKLTVYNVIQVTVELPIMALVTFYTNHLTVIAVSFVAIETIFYGIYTYITVRSIGNDGVDDNWRRQSYTYTIMDLSSIVFGKADIAIMGFFLSPGSIAIYGLVMKIAEVFFMIIKSTITGILPSLYKATTIQVNHFFKYAAASVLMPLVLLAFIKYPILLMYGSELNEAILYAQIYLFVIPIYFLAMLSNFFLIKEKLLEMILFNKSLVTIGVLFLYILLIPLYGILGGIIASMLYFTIEALLNVRALKIRPLAGKPV